MGQLELDDPDCPTDVSEPSSARTGETGDWTDETDDDKKEGEEGSDEEGECVSETGTFPVRPGTDSTSFKPTSRGCTSPNWPSPCTRRCWSRWPGLSTTGRRVKTPTPPVAGAGWETPVRGRPGPRPPNPVRQPPHGWGTPPPLGPGSPPRLSSLGSVMLGLLFSRCKPPGLVQTPFLSALHLQISRNFFHAGQMPSGPTRIHGEGSRRRSWGCGAVPCFDLLGHSPRQWPFSPHLKHGSPEAGPRGFALRLRPSAPSPLGRSASLAACFCGIGGVGALRSRWQSRW